MIIKDVRAQNLLFAKDYIEKVIKTLNMQSSECSECHHTRYSNFSDFNMHKELTAIATKLKKFALNLQKEADGKVTKTGKLLAG